MQREIFLSFFAFTADVIFQLHGEASLLEKSLSMGRKTARAVSLFNQYDAAEQGMGFVDGLAREAEDRLRNPSE